MTGIGIFQASFSLCEATNGAHRCLTYWAVGCQYVLTNLNPRLINEYMHRPDVDGFLISHDAIVWTPYIFEESEIVFCTVIS